MSSFQKLLRDLQKEIGFTASRSGGPGGQYVNKVNSRVTLHFDLSHSQSLTKEQKGQIAKALGTRINKDGVLKLHAQRHRSQAANRADLLARFSALIVDALHPRAIRKRTSIPSVARVRRVKDKRQQSLVKKMRSTRHLSDEE